MTGDFRIEEMLVNGEMFVPKSRLEQAEQLLRDIEGTILAYWTDIPEAELERLRLRIQEVSR